MSFRIYRSLLALLFCATAAFSTRGTTIPAATLSSADVQAAITKAAEGDTVSLPAGTANWTSGVTINNKALKFEGAGINLTILTNSIATDIPMIRVTNCGRKQV